MINDSSGPIRSRERQIIRVGRGRRDARGYRSKVSELGLASCSSDEELGGMGLPMMAYSRIFENLATHDASLTVTVGAHQSIGYKGLLLFGSPEQKEKISSPTCNRQAYRRLLSHRAKQWFRCRLD